MIVEIWGRRAGYGLALVTALVATACNETNGDDGIDAPPPPPTVTFNGLVPHQWSMAMINGRTQIALSDISGPTVCASSSDQHNTIGAEGGQILIHLPDATAETCPVGNYELDQCANAPGNEALVPAGCAFYRKFDATGALLGSAPSLTGTVKIAGTASACTLRITVGFLGKSFDAQETLVDGATAQPWCFAN